MGYQLLNTVITFNWTLKPTAVPPIAGDIDVILTKPDGTETYASAASLTFVAPTGSVDGSVTYQVTVDQLGRWRALLVQGDSAAYTVYNRREIYVVDPPDHVKNGPTAKTTLSPIIPPSSPFTTMAAWGDIGWYDITGVNEDFSREDGLIITGRRQLADANATIMLLNMKTGAFTNYTTLPFTDPHACCMNPSGKAYVLKRNPVSSAYRCYYADAPYTSWLQATPENLFAGQRHIIYDPVLDKVFWTSNVHMQTADGNGIAFSEQQYNLNNDGTTQQDVGHTEAIKRVYFSGGNSVLMIGGTAGVGGERIHGVTATSGTTPLSFLTVPDLLKPMGSEFGAKPAEDFAMNPAGNKVIFFGGTATVMASASSTTGNNVGTWNDLTDLASLPDWDLTAFYGAFLIKDFGKMYIAGNVPITGQKIFESTNGVNWSVSSDTRLTDYKIKAGNHTTNYTELTNGGFAFVDQSVGPLLDRVVFTVV